MDKEARKVWAAVTVQVGLCVLILAMVMWSANLKEGAGARFAHFGPGTLHPHQCLWHYHL